LEALRLKCNQLNDDKTKQTFIRNVTAQLPVTGEHDTIDKKSEQFVKALNLSAKMSLPPKIQNTTREI